MLAGLLKVIDRPLFIVGQEKNAGKTVTLNRLRSEARAESLQNFGLCTMGWDGELRDHLDGGIKPEVQVYKGDVVMTAGRLLARSSALIEVEWADSRSGRMGRFIIGRCLRGGSIELLGPSTVGELAHSLKRMSEMGAQRLLIDGAADRRTQIAAVKDSRVGLVFRPKTREALESFVVRIIDTLSCYRLETTTLKRPLGLKGEQIAISSDEAWHIVDPGNLAELSNNQSSDTIWLGSALTSTLLEALMASGFRHLVVDDPSRIFLPPAAVTRLMDKGFKLEVARKTEPAFVAVRSESGPGRSLAPGEILKRLEEALDGIPYFDPWVSAVKDGGEA